MADFHDLRSSLLLLVFLSLPILVNKHNQAIPRSGRKRITIIPLEFLEEKTKGKKFRLLKSLSFEM